MDRVACMCETLCIFFKYLFSREGFSHIWTQVCVMLCSSSVADWTDVRLHAKARGNVPSHNSLPLEALKTFSSFNIKDNRMNSGVCELKETNIRADQRWK